MHSKMSVLVAMSAIFFGNLLVTNHAEQILSFQWLHPTGNIYVGDQVQLQCVISGFVGDTDTVVIFQRIGNTVIRTLATHEGRYFDAPPNVQSSGIQDNSIVSVTINDIDVSFSGNFTCHIATISGTGLDLQHLKLNVLLQPPPSCSVTPLNKNLVFNDMDEIRLTCTSEIGSNDSPQNLLLWNLDSQMAITIPLADTTSSSNTVMSNIDLILNTIYDGTTIRCLRLNDRETCSIGPLQVRSGLLPTTDTLLDTITESSNETPNYTGLQSGVIVAIVLSIIVIMAIVSVAIIVGIRSRHVSVKTNHASADNSHDNPHMSIKNHGGHSSAEGENYTSLQKNTLEDKSAKLYQDLIPVPRLPNNHETDGDQCTNAGMVSLGAEEPDYVVKSVSHKTMNASKNASKNDSGDYEDVEELPGETYEEIPEKCYEEIPESRAGISPIPAAAQEPKSVVQHVYLDFTGVTDANTGAPEATASTPNQHDQPSPLHVNSSNEVVYANQTRVKDFK